MNYFIVKDACIDANQLYLLELVDKAAPQLRLLVAGFTPRRLDFEPGSGICGGQSGAGVGFLQVLRFPLPSLIPPTAPHSLSIIRGWYNRPISVRSTKWTQSHPTPRN
jgi:hypothetical protein